METPDDSPLPPIRIDLHCHSTASNRPAETVLKAIHCPESYSDPEAVYAQAKSRGMDLVTITDHDCIDGVLRIADRPDVLVGEELTCWFPEDGCKMHVVVCGITPAEHAELQERAKDIYGVAEYIEARRIAHAVAHPIYRQNDKLERWHLERLMLLFKGFECLNGAHSPLHREAFEPLLDRLSEEEIARLAKRHALTPRWPEPWIKSRTGGSDDHGLLNVGRTWTEFPGDARSADAVLRCLREGRCRPGGESGSSLKLAHTFYSIAVRYYSRHILPAGAKPNLPTLLLQLLVGEKPLPARSTIARLAVKSKLRRWVHALTPPLLRHKDPAEQIPALREIFLASARQRLEEHPALLDSLRRNLPPLGDEQAMFAFVSSVNRDVTGQIAAAISESIDRASFTGLFNSIAGALAQQFVLLPYYFAAFHQNRERHLLRSLTGQRREIDRHTLRVGLFTDTLDDVNGVSRFLRDMAGQAIGSNCQLTLHTCSQRPVVDLPNRRNFIPLLSRQMPYYQELSLHLPPVLEVFEWTERQQFDAIHVSTPGPMGLCGWLVAKMLRVPLLGTHHTDLPAYLEDLSADHRLARGMALYLRWFYGQMSTVFARSREYRSSLQGFGLPAERLALIPPSVDTRKFNPRQMDADVWARLGVRQPRRLLYAGRVSLEKNLPMLATVFRRLCTEHNDVALIIAGDGPYRERMQRDLAGVPAYFLGFQNDAQLATLYASADLFAFPSRTDTLGQVVLEAQASGLPALVSDEGGPAEQVDDGVTGLVLGAADTDAWCHAIDDLLRDEPLRLRLSRTAAQRSSRYSLAHTFEQFWAEHLAAAQARTPDSPSMPTATELVIRD